MDVHDMFGDYRIISCDLPAGIRGVCAFNDEGDPLPLTDHCHTRKG